MADRTKNALNDMEHLSEAERVFVLLGAFIEEFHSGGFATEPGRALKTSLALMRPSQRQAMFVALQEADL